MFRQDSNARTSDNQSGFSIIEMLVAVVVLTVGLVSIVGMSVYVSRANSISNEINVLAAAAQDQVDRIRTSVWTQGTEDAMIKVGGTIGSDAVTPPIDVTPPSDTEVTPPDISPTPLSATSSPSTSTSPSGYQYKYDPTINPHQASVANTPVGDLLIRWSVRQGSTPDLRYVTIRVTPVLYSRYLKDGYTVSTIINRG